MTNPTPAVRTVSKERLRTIRRKQMRYNWDAVSYTQLDVYKRQMVSCHRHNEENRADWRIRRMLEEDLTVALACRCV